MAELFQQTGAAKYYSFTNECEGVTGPPGSELFIWGFAGDAGSNPATSTNQKMPNLPTTHKPKWKRVLEAKADMRRRRKRALPTDHPRWRRIRAKVLDNEPWCRHCREQGKWTPADQVDHINGRSEDNRKSNLQPLCAPCHHKKTALERRAKKECCE